MHRSRSLALAAFLAASALPVLAGAQTPPPPFTLGDAVAYALNHSAAVALKVAAVAQAYNALGKQRIASLPTVNGSLQSYLAKNANYGGAYAIIGAQQQQQFSQNTAQIGTQYTLQTGGLSLIQLTTARAQVAQARQDLANTEDQIASTVTNAFYSVVQKQAIVAVDRSDLAYQKVLLSDARVKERAGVAAGVDVLKARVAQAKSNSTLIGAQTDVINARETLAQSIGAPLETRFAFPAQIQSPPLPSQPLAVLESIAIAARPDLKSAQDALVAAMQTRKGFGRELFPSVQLGAAFGNQFSPTNVQYVFNSAGRPIGIAPRVGSPGFWSLSAVSTFTLPLVDYGARHFELKNDDAQVVAAKDTVDQTASQVRLDVRESYRSAQTALAQLGYANDESRLGTESARIAQLQYQHGLIALSDVLQTQQQSVVAQSDFVNAKVAYIDAIVKLRVSLGIYDARSAVADLR
ncbi:MAG: TolC family protein [Vulcanimicrobiaceae bacterium]